MHIAACMPGTAECLAFVLLMQSAMGIKLLRRGYARQSQAAKETLKDLASALCRPVAFSLNSLSCLTRCCHCHRNILVGGP